MGRERAIRTVIVDDERLARQRIRRLLEEESDVDVIAECRNGYDAIRVVQQTQPDRISTVSPSIRSTR